MKRLLALLLSVFLTSTAWAVVGEQTVTATMTAGTDDVYSTIFQNRNTGWSATSLQFGAEPKFGLLNYTYFKFPTLNVPKGAVVTNAYVTMKAATTQSAALVGWVSALLYDNRWQVTSRTGWSSDVSHDFQFAVKSNTGTIASFTPGVGASTIYWGLRSNTANRYLKLAQSGSATATDTLTKAEFYLKRTGNPTGEVWVKVYTANADGSPNTLIDTSGNANAGTISTNGAVVTFTFLGGQTLTSGTTYVAELDGNYALSGVNYISALADETWWLPTGAYPSGVAQVYGTGVGFDDQNYMSQSMLAGFFGIGQLGSLVAWNPVPAFVVNTTYQTPDLSLIVQELVDNAGFTEGGPMGIALQPHGTTPINQFRDIYAYDSGASNAATLTVTYIPQGLHVAGQTVAITGETVQIK